MRKARAVQRRKARRGALGCCCGACVLYVVYAFCFAAAPRFFSYDDDAALRRPLRREKRPLRLRGPAGASQRGGWAPLRRGRLAFLFLVRSDIPTEPIWAAFFREAADYEDLYAVYSHPKRDFQFRAGSLFHGSEIANRTRVSWGSITVAYAELLLLRAALADARNERFLLVSESCVPVHPFLCLWDFLFATEKSLVKTWKTTDRATLYDFADRDADVKTRWRKGHQWVGLTRRHAALVATSADWYAMFFDAHARTPIAAEFRVKYKQQHHSSDGDRVHHNFADEHLVQTVLALGGAEPDLLPASPTLIRFGDFDKRISGGAPRRQRKRRRRALLELNINEAMNSDWRATSYDPKHITPLLLDDARGTCTYADTPAPLESPDVEVRTRTGAVLPWANDSATSQAACRFDADRPSPCFLLLRKIPEKSVDAYRRALWPAG